MAMPRPLPGFERPIFCETSVKRPCRHCGRRAARPAEKCRDGSRNEAFLVLAAPDVVEIPLDVAENHEVEQAVIIQVHPGSARGPAAAADAGFFRDIGERAVAIVMIELVAAVGGHVQIFEAIVVIIADGDSHPVAYALQSGLLGYIFECAV